MHLYKARDIKEADINMFIIVLSFAGQHSFNTCDVPRTEDVGLLTKFRFIVGPAL